MRSSNREHIISISPDFHSNNHALDPCVIAFTIRPMLMTLSAKSAISGSVCVLLIVFVIDGIEIKSACFLFRGFLWGLKEKPLIRKLQLDIQ